VKTAREFLKNFSKLTKRDFSFRNLLISSAIISLVLLVLSSLWHWEEPILAYRIGNYPIGKIFYFFDILQLLSFIILVIMIWRFLHIRKRTILVIILILFIGLELYWGNSFAEKFFSHPAVKPEFFEEPFLFNFVKSKIATLDSGVANNSSPSGFAFRQWIVTLLSLSLLVRNNKRLKKKKGWSKFLTIFFITSFVYVALARILRQQHTPVDVAIAMCLGTAVLFLSIFISDAIFRIKIDKELYHFYLTFVIVSLIIFMTISYDPFLWIWTSLPVITIMGVLCRLKHLELN